MGERFAGGQATVGDDGAARGAPQGGWPSALLLQLSSQPLNLFQMIQVMAGECFQLHPEGDNSALRVKACAAKIFS